MRRRCAGAWLACTSFVSSSVRSYAIVAWVAASILTLALIAHFDERGEAATALVVACGLLAYRSQRRALALEHRLALEVAAREHEERLARCGNLASLGALAIGVAHEIGTPLAVISARAELLGGCGDARVDRDARIIEEQADKIARVLRGFLGFVRGETPRLARVAAEDLAAAATSMVAHRIERAGGAMVVDVAPDLPPLTCDRPLIEQALVALLLRACDAIGADGKIELIVRADERSVAFSVEDDGARDDLALRETLSWRSGVRAADDTALGVVVAQEVARHHGGCVVVLPRSPRGTRARLELPADHGGESVFDRSA